MFVQTKDGKLPFTLYLKKKFGINIYILHCLILTAHQLIFFSISILCARMNSLMGTEVIKPQDCSRFLKLQVSHTAGELIRVGDTCKFSLGNKN